MGFRNAVWDPVKYTHGQILTTFVKDRGIFADDERSNIDWFGPLRDVFVNSLAWEKTD